MELGIPYELVGPDGTRAVFGNSDVAKADPDWIGYVNPDNQIPGLDGADHRESSDVLVEEDGGINGSIYRGRRPIVLHVDIDPNATTQTMEAYERKLKRASRALRSDATLRWSPSDGTAQRLLTLRRNAKLSITGRRPRQVQVPMVSAQHAVLSAAESQLTIVPGVAAGLIGYASPYSSPYGTELGVTGSDSVVNDGDEETWPRFRIDGPITNPVILNNSIGLGLALLYTLSAGQWIDIDFRRRTVLFNGTTDRYSAVVFPGSAWWKLRPGLNDVRLLASAFSAGAQLTVFWRHAWE